MRKLRCGRREARKRIDLEATIITRGGGRLSCRVTNLSSRGAWLASPQTLTVGDKVRLRVALPGCGCPAGPGTTEAFALRVEVMWVVPCVGMGVELVDVTPEVQAELRDALRSFPDAADVSERFCYRDAYAKSA